MTIASEPRRRMLVTGVSSGLGRATVLALLASGASVVGVARRAELGLDLQHHANSPEFTFLAADISRPSECERVIAHCVAAMDGVDVLINNAGARTDPPIMPMHDVDEANWDTVVDTNLKGPFFLTRFALPVMLGQQRGLVINIASQAAEIGTFGMAPYTASKAGLVGLTRSIAVEYLDDGIRAIAVILGGTATGQENRTMGTVGTTQSVRPAGTKPAAFEPRLYSPEEVARTLVMLTSEAAATITGASIAIDHATTAGALTSAYIQEVIARAGATS